MMSFVFDLTKDIAFVLYLYDILFDETAEGRISSDDYCLLSMVVASLTLGQIVMSTFCFLHRYKAASLCSHQASNSLRFSLTTIMIIFFPLTGIVMSANSYMDERLTKDQFES